MSRMKNGEMERPSAVKLALRRHYRMLRPLSLSLVSFMIVMAGLLVVRSAQTGGAAARVQKSFARAIDLRVQHIDILNRQNTPDKLLRAALNVNEGDPILGFSVSDARDRIESLSWVQNVAVERRLPDTIVVDLTERRPFAIWQNQGKFQLIDRNGETVTNEDVAQFATLPLVVGTGAPPFAGAMLDALDRAPDVHSRVAAIVRVGERRWNLQLKNGVTIMLPEGHEEIALKRLEQLQAEQSLLDRPLVFIDLRLPDRLAVRLRPQGQSESTPPASPAAVPAHTPPPPTATRRAT